jgi:RNA polymerase sigma-70 factor (ECF subfamily)
MNAIGQPRLELRHSGGQQRGSELLPAAHDEHVHSLLSYGVGLIRGRGGAEDSVQEEFLRASRNEEVLERTGGSERRWLWTMARRIVTDQWRSSSRRHEVLTDHVPEATVAETAQQTADRQRVQAALKTLSTEHRQALFETYFRGASVAQAADTLGVSPNTVKSRTHYALHALRKAIDGMGGVA